MAITLPLKDMTIEEKIQAMETIWADLCKDADNIPSPAWHKNILKEREDGLIRGADEFIDWETAKRKIRNGI